MATCGSRTMQTSACNDCAPVNCPNTPVGRLPRFVQRVFGLAMLAMTIGCAMPPISDGRPARTNGLQVLETGVSGKSEVRAALGEPRGNGMVRHTTDPATRRSIWYYEYVRAKGDQLGLKILLVFFDDETYDGHLWFAGDELVKFGEW